MEFLSWWGLQRRRLLPYSWMESIDTKPSKLREMTLGTDCSFRMFGSRLMRKALLSLVIKLRCRGLSFVKGLDSSSTHVLRAGGL